MAAVEIGSVRTSSSSLPRLLGVLHDGVLGLLDRVRVDVLLGLAAERVDALGDDVDLQVGAGHGGFLARRGRLLPLLVLGLGCGGSVLGLLVCLQGRVLGGAGDLAGPPRSGRRGPRGPRRRGPRRGLLGLAAGSSPAAWGSAGGTSTVASSASSYASSAASSAEPAISRASSVGTACPLGLLGARRGCPLTLPSGLDLQRLRFLGDVRVLGAGVDLQLGDLLAREPVARQHALSPPGAGPPRGGGRASPRGCASAGPRGSRSGGSRASAGACCRSRGSSRR